MGFARLRAVRHDTRFQGPHAQPDAIGTVVKFCLSLGVVPVFAPPREHGMQNAIESFNGRWQANVWGDGQCLGTSIGGGQTLDPSPGKVCGGY